MNAPGERLRRALAAVGYLLLVAATILGAWAVAQRLAQGPIHEGTTVHVPWGLWVALYILFLGMSGGCFLLSTLGSVFGVTWVQPAVPLALFQSLLCLMLAGLLILIDLGHPERMYKVLTSFNPTSAMAWMGVLYAFYSAVLLGSLYFALRADVAQRALSGGRLTWLYRALCLGRTNLDDAALAGDRKWLRRMGLLAIPLILIVLGCEGSIFSVAKARPNWFGGLFPVVILTSALASGAALLTFLSAVVCRIEKGAKVKLVQSLCLLTVGMLLFEALIFSFEALAVLYGSVEHEASAWRALILGRYSLMFWGVQVGVGILVPALIVAIPATRRHVEWLGLAGLAGVIGMIGMRFNLVVPALLVPVLPGLSAAYHHVRFEEGYWPQSNEWLVGLGVFALGIWVSIIALRLLPLDGGEVAPS